MIRKSFLTILSLVTLAMGVASAATNVTFNLTAPRAVTVGEPFRVEFTANQKVDNFSAPAFDGFTVVAGPSTSQGTKVEYINGKMSKSINISYTYVLMADDKGNKTIGKASCTYKNRKYSTKPTVIEVVAQQLDTASDSNSSSGATSLAKDDILLVAKPSKKSVYKGEALSISLMLYYRASVTNVGNFKPASFNGFWKYDFQPEQQQPQRITHNGKVYDAIPIREFLIYPQKSGNIVIESMQLTASISIPIANNSNSGGSLFDSFFGSMNSYTTVEKHLSSLPLSITVKELPLGAPASFTGAVGRFNLSSALHPTTLAANSAATLSLSITGSGNLPLITAPKAQLPQSFEEYSAKTNDTFSEMISGISSTRSIEYPFIARSEGDFTIAPVEFTYFDLESLSYKTLKSKTFEIKVTEDRSSTAANSVIVSPLLKEDLKILGKDINFIKQGEPSLLDADRFYVGSLAYFGTLVAIIALFIAILLSIKRYIKEINDKVKVKNKKANKLALSRLKLARKAMNEDNKVEFYQQLLKALNGYVADKLNIDIVQFTKEAISDKLLSQGLKSEDVNQLIDTISQCEAAHYSQGGITNSKMLYDSALQLLGRLESKL